MWTKRKEKKKLDLTHPMEDLAALDNLVGRYARVRLSDSRVLVGVLDCIDQAQNLILSSTWEHKVVQDTVNGPRGEKRYIGVVIVNSQHRVSMDVALPQEKKEKKN